MSLVIQCDYDTIITKNRDYRYDFDFLQTQQPSQQGHCATVPTVGAGGGEVVTGQVDWTVVVRCDNYCQ